MARQINENEHAGRRGEILDAVQGLIYAKGFQQMTIQNILDALQISKGAFYHYFDSKQAVLEALVVRMIDGVEELVAPIVHDPQLAPLEKLERFFAVTVDWKTERKDFLIALLQGWYSDDNALVRQKVQAAAARLVTPLLTEVLRKGIHSGELAAAHPQYTAEVVYALMVSMGSALSALLLAPQPTPEDLRSVENIVAAYTEAIERVLYIPAGSLRLVDAVTLQGWFAPREPGAGQL